MPSSFRSSGDLLADRRLAYAEALVADGDAAAAADLIAETLEGLPAWGAGWFALGGALEAAGDRPGATAAFERALDLDPADALGARLRLGRLGTIAPPAAPPPAFVRDLFDGYAPRFDAALVDGLGYRGPELVAAALETAASGRRFDRGLDLGCGTGLMAKAIRASVGHLAGVDLSAGMVAAARAKGLYDRLVVGELVEMLAGEPPGSFDLITAADVFCYLGDLTPVLAASTAALTRGGLLAFVAETASDPEASDGYMLKDSLRYGHRQDYVIDIGGRCGLDILSVRREPFRTDRGVPVEGLVVVCGKP